MHNSLVVAVRTCSSGNSSGGIGIVTITGWRVLENRIFFIQRKQRFGNQSSHHLTRDFYATANSTKHIITYAHDTTRRCDYLLHVIIVNMALARVRGLPLLLASFPAAHACSLGFARASVCSCIVPCRVRAAVCADELDLGDMILKANQAAQVTSGT